MDPGGSNDEVVLHAVKDGNTITMNLGRATAEAKRMELEADGWTVEIRESDRA